jgi:Trp operon repressor
MMFRKSSEKLFLLILIFFTASAASYAQDWTLPVIVKVEKNDKKMEGASVTLLKGGSTVQSLTTTTSGKAEFKLAPNGDYTITVTRAGHITKKISISTFGVPEERGKAGFGPYEFTVGIFEMMPNADYSILNQPIAKVKYDGKEEEFSLDEAYTNSILAALAKIEEMARKAAELEKQYRDIISKADKSYASKDYNGAKASYQEALKLKPSEEYPKEKIADCDKFLGDIAKQAAADKDYNDAIAQGSAAMTAKKWDDAKAAFTKAGQLKPAEQLPKTKLKEIDDLLAKEAKDKELNEKYQTAVKKGDDAFAAKDWSNAKTAFTEASSLKPGEQYPKTKISEIDGILAKELKDKELNEKYQAAIKKGDDAFASKSWTAAKTAYTEASGLKASEQYPKTKISEIDGILANETKAKELEAKYLAAIKKGDDAFAAKDWNNAKAGYNEALGLKAGEKYPKDKITEIDGLIAKDLKDKELNEKYQAAIKKGDDAFAAKTYAAAKTAYSEALALKAGEKYPKDKIAEIDGLLANEAKAKELEAKYLAAIKKGDDAFGAKTWAAAKTAYSEAAGLKPAEEYPKKKIAEIDDLLAKDAKDKELNAKYQAAIQKGDKAFTAKNYDEAKTSYNEALTLKSEEAYPKGKLKEIEDLLAKDAKAKELNEKYNAAITKADKAFGTKDWENAKAGYNEALGFKPDEAYPKNKLKEIDAAIAKDAKDKELNEKYAAAITKGDASFAKQEYDAAKTAYTEASALKASEKYPKDKITEINNILAKNAKDKELEAKYLAAIKKGDDAFAAKTYPAAKTAFNEALTYKPNEEYPKSKLKEIDDLLATDAKAKELNAKYQAAITKGDQAFTAKNWAAAKTAYTDASGLKPAEEYPKNKLTEIDGLIAKDAQQKEINEKYNAAIKKADQALTAKNYDEAKAGYNEALTIKSEEAYPKNKLKEIDDLLAKDAKTKELNEKYNAAIAKGDASFAKQEYDAAKTAYNEAIALKSAEVYPKNKIKEIDGLLAKTAKDKELNEKYNAAIAKGDDAFGKQSYADAKTAYKEALTYKAAEQYPKDKIKEIDDILAKAALDVKAKELEAKYLAAIKKGDDAFAAKTYAAAKTAYNEALTYKSTEEYPKNKLKEIDDLLATDAKSKELNAKYQAAITKGDQAFTAKNYAAAKTAYTDASGLKPDEQYPKDKINEIDKMLGDMAAIDLKYKEAIAKADNALAAKDYTNAKSAYSDASAIKPSEAYPKNKIAEIDKLLADMTNKEQKYKDAIAKGDNAFSAKSYAAAKTAFNEALTYKPNEEYPKSKLKEIDDLLATDAKAKELNAKYQAAITKGDQAFTAKNWAAAKTAYTDASALKPAEEYPKNKLAEIDGLIAKDAQQKEINEKYNAAIKKADQALTAKNYDEAKAGYNEALTIKSEEAYPKNKLKEIDDLLAKDAKTKELNEKYNAAIAKGDASFAKQEYDAAKTAYNEAIALKSAEVYPKNKIKEIDALLAKTAKDKELNEKYNAAIAKGDDAFGKQSYADAKAAYKEASTLKPTEQYPKDKIAEIDGILSKTAQDAKTKELNEKYAAAISKGDNAFGTKDYTNAKLAYKEASTLKPTEQYPKDKLAEIDRMEKDILSQQQKDTKYKTAITKADGLYAANKLNEAKTAYQDASAIKEDEQYPKDKIAEITKKLDEIAAAKKKEQDYKDAIAKGDKAFTAKGYKDAMTAYKEASALKPEEKYPKEKIKAIEDILKKDLQANKNGDTGPKTLTDEERKKQAYAELLAKYPPGVTEESKQEGDCKVLKRIVVKDNEVKIYERKVWGWGGTFWFKDGSPISEAIFEAETN